jgi:cytochrome b
LPKGSASWIIAALLLARTIADGDGNADHEAISGMTITLVAFTTMLAMPWAICSKL